MVAIKNPVHLHHASSLSQIDVGSHSIPRAPFVNDDEAQGLDIDKIRVVEVLVDQGNGLGSERLGGLSGASISADKAR